MIKLVPIGWACMLVAGCADQGWGWMRTDGQSAKSDPSLHAQFEADKSGCIGQMQKAGLSGAASDRSGALQTTRRTRSMNVIRDCMAQRGYVVVPKAEIEAAR